jgi:hypothetical protein
MKEELQMISLTKLQLTAVFMATLGVMSILAASFFAPMRAANEKLVELETAPQAAATYPLATKITFRGDDIGDLASLLEIRKLVCEVELRPKVPFERLSLDVEFYKDGQKQKTAPAGLAFKADEWEKIIPVKVAFLVADLDYLPLRGAVKNHHRMQVKMALKGGFSRGNTDVPKELFDFSRVSGSGPFPPKASSATEAPLLFIKARSRDLTNADTVSEFLEKNSTGDVLIVYLRVRKE